MGENKFVSRGTRTLDVIKVLIREEKGVFKATSKLVLCWMYCVTKHFDRYGIELKLNSMMDDGTQSWIVISRGESNKIS